MVACRRRLCRGEFLPRASGRAALAYGPPWPRCAWEFAAICIAGSVIGGARGYAIGYFVFEPLMRTIWAHVLFGQDPLGAFQAWYAQWGLWVILIKGLTPIPYKIITIASGAAKFDF